MYMVVPAFMRRIRVLLTLFAWWVTFVQAQPFRHEVSAQSIRLTLCDKNSRRYLLLNLQAS